MDNKLALNQDQLSRISSYEASIAHWSSEYTIAALKARKMLEGIDNLYSTRQNYLNTLLTEAGVDVKKVKDVSMDQDNNVVYTMVD